MSRGLQARASWLSKSVSEYRRARKQDRTRHRAFAECDLCGVDTRVHEFSDELGTFFYCKPCIKAIREITNNEPRDLTEIFAERRTH